MQTLHRSWYELLNLNVEILAGGEHYDEAEARSREALSSSVTM